ncbi:MAG: hypothetical protein RSC31_07245, partial [Anaerovoracaceae bacterium]
DGQILPIFLRLAWLLRNTMGNRLKLPIPLVGMAFAPSNQKPRHCLGMAFAPSNPKPRHRLGMAFAKLDVKFSKSLLASLISNPKQLLAMALLIRY